MKDSFSKFSKWHFAALLLFILFMPFPTELIPEWKMQFVDEQNDPLVNVRTEQSWESYTFMGVGGYDTKCTDTNGFVVYPQRLLWAGLVSRIVSPLAADLFTLAHGSTGTDAHIRVFDKNYISDYQYWREREKIYTRHRDALPRLAAAKRSDIQNADSCMQPTGR